jgi:FAD/FMN-containing dehydrogenase/Fe-S oxidoreductase
MTLNHDFVNELRGKFTGDIRLDLGSRILYSTDASIYQIEPLGVVIPRTGEDLQAAVELAAKYHIPILPRGSGSSLAGQAIGEALILDCSRWLDRIIEIDPESMTATVEPGVILSTLNRAAAEFGLQFGPDPASAERATMGGIIGNNATGAHSILYGMTADHILSADVIHADGSLATWRETEIGNLKLEPVSIFSSIISTAIEIRSNDSDAIKANYPRSWRNSAGYRLNYLLPWSPSAPSQWSRKRYPDIKGNTINLATLLAGSEGTLGVIRRALVNLVPKPKHTILGILAYGSMAEACDAVPDLLKYAPSAIELIPQLILRLARGIPAYARQMGWVTSADGNKDVPPALLVIEFSGNNFLNLKQMARRLRQDVVILESVEEQAQVWNIRKVGLGILDSRPQSARPAAFIEDCAIPVEYLGEFVREIERILAEHGTEAGIYAHASAGCLHIRPILDLRTGQGVRFLREIAEQVVALTLRLGGSMSSEHGDGIVRGEWLEKTYGEDVSRAMRLLKKAADPYNLLNPQKMFDAPSMDSRLRYGVDYKVQAWSPGLDFAQNGGFVAALEQCNGQGVCRKETGVMCPSFQATRDEKYSTRGRANLLRSMIRIGAGGQRAGFEKTELSQDVYDALDLCLACKGCKAECPSGVDMAKIKFVFQAEYYKKHPRLLRDYLFGYFHVTARLLSSIASLVNFGMGIGPMRRFVAHIMKITPDRPFPKFSRKETKVRSLPGHQKVMLLRDPFTHYVEPIVEQAAFDLLFAMGFDVEVLAIIGAGASLLSKGFIPAARNHARRILDELKRRDPDNSLSIVGMEPSEIYSLKHDYLDLLPERQAEITSRSNKTWLIEEFLIRSVEFNDLRVATKYKKIIFQPHCHQKAEGPANDGLANGTNASVELLRHLGFEVSLIDAGCCGMAGTFGYEEEHYNLSQRVGALKLFPFINNHENGYSLAATGAACRMQIVQGTGRTAVHPIVLAELAVRNPGLQSRNLTE